MTSMFYQPPKPGRPKRDAGKMDQRNSVLLGYYWNWAPRNKRLKTDAYAFARWYLKYVERRDEITDSDVDRIRKRVERAIKRTKIRVL